MHLSTLRGRKHKSTYFSPQYHEILTGIEISNNPITLNSEITKPPQGLKVPNQGPFGRPFESAAITTKVKPKLRLMWLNS